MGLHTYNAKIGGRSLQMKMKKDRAERIASKLNTLMFLAQHKIEYSGIIGKPETQNKWGSMTLFGPCGFPIRDQEAFEKKRNEFYASLPQLITEENAIELLEKMQPIFEAHVPVEDRRTTEEAKAAEREESNRVHAEFEAKRAAAKAEFLAEFSNGETLNVAEGLQAVTIHAVYDDSDVMTDYFNRHASYGEVMVLQIVGNAGTPHTEAKCRMALSHYPELQHRIWTWEKQNYSMGHGNFLTSETVGECKGVHSRTTDQPRYSWEVRFHDSRKDTTFPCFRGYANIPAPALGSSEVSVEGVVVRRNEQLGGVEVLFPSKPDRSVIDALKSRGFRWSQRQGLWWARFSPEKMKFAQSLIDKTLEKVDVPQE